MDNNVSPSSSSSSVSPSPSESWPFSAGPGLSSPPSVWLSWPSCKYNVHYYLKNALCILILAVLPVLPSQVNELHCWAELPSKSFPYLFIDIISIIVVFWLILLLLLLLLQEQLLLVDLLHVLLVVLVLQLPDEDCLLLSHHGKGKGRKSKKICGCKSAMPLCSVAAIIFLLLLCSMTTLPLVQQFSNPGPPAKIESPIYVSYVHNIFPNTLIQNVIIKALLVVNI